MTMNYHPYIVRDLAICGGEPVVRGPALPPAPCWQAWAKA